MHSVRPPKLSLRTMYRPPAGVVTAVQPSCWQIVVVRGGACPANDAPAGLARAAELAIAPSTSSGAARRLSIR